MSSINTVTLVGRIGQDPDIRYSKDGKAVATLSLATSEKWKDRNTGQVQESTDWHRVILFGRQAEIADQYVKKGSLIGITGSIKYGKYTDKNGIERYTTEIRARDLQLLSGGQNQSQQQDQGFNHQQNTADFDNFDEDVPF